MVTYFRNPDFTNTFGSAQL